MIAEIGQILLISALLAAVSQFVFPLWGSLRNNPALMEVAKPAARLQFGLILAAFVLLTHAFIVQDFSLTYVAQNSNSLLPLHYRFSAVWGAHEGSLLLWLLILTGWTLAISFSRSLPATQHAQVLAVLGAIAVGFTLFVLLTSNPFDRTLPPPMDGNDLNPLLQDIGLIIHPPMLYMGYVGFAIPFAFAIAALLSGRLDQAWAKAMRPWTNWAWAFLTLGIALGSWWAYYELGWGGWWFWDPVENASFMPWLVGTGLLHTTIVSARRGAFKAWTVLLAISAFSLSLLGTFLVRSGVLTSVHAFANDPERGIFVLTFLGIVVGIALTLFAWRAPTVADGPRSYPVSRESGLLLNTLFFTVATLVVLLGTIAPLIAEAFGHKISVGAPYFGALFTMVMVPMVLLLPAGPLLQWRKSDGKSLLRSLRFPAVLTIIATPLIWMWLELPARGLLGLAGSLWILLGMLVFIRQHKRWTPAFVGMTVAHLGVAVFLIGVSMVEYASTERDLRLAPDEQVEVGGYDFTFNGVRQEPGPNYQAWIGEFDVSRGGDPVTHMRAEKRHYGVRGQVMTEAALDPGLTRDLYVSLAEPLGDDGSWAIRIYIRPFVRWIWLGALMMAIGACIALIPVARKREPS